MEHNPKEQIKLNQKEKIIVGVLRQVAQPLSAYDIIELLPGQGVSSPPTVYRALKRLVEAGLAHRIESLNAFVSCAHGEHSGSAVFAICDDCGTVSEFHHDAVMELLAGWATKTAFRLERTTIEMRGHCSACT